MIDTEKESKEDLTGLYDLAIPIGMPISVIHELVDKFDVEPLTRMAKVGLLDDETEEREILVLRGELETIKAAEKHMFEALDKRVARWESDERSEHYKEIYEKERQERLKKLQEKNSQMED